MDICSELLTNVTTTNEDVNQAIILFVAACLSMFVAGSVALMMHFNKPLL
jgi:hypothetical protein